ncbi:MAG: hypothetical protein ACO1SV_25890 [Fimbriimonas sp.]
MRTEQTTEREEDRLSTEELHALRARLFGEVPDRKEVATVADLAEALGRTPEEVWRHLDRLRAERAFAPAATPPRRSQLPLLGLAGVLLVAAYGIYVVTPRRMTLEEMEARLEESKARRKNKPKRIQYPIAHAHKFEGPLPAGVALTIQGVKTETALRTSVDPGPVTAEQARKYVADALGALYDAAIQNEATAPEATVPSKPPPYPGATVPTPDHFVIGVGGNSWGTISTIPTDAAQGKLMIADIAKGYVDSIVAGQNQRLKKPPKGQWQSPPPGFTVLIGLGKPAYSMSSSSLLVRPVDPVAVRQRLEEAVRDSLDRALHPEAPMPGMPPVQSADVPEAELKITGPRGDIVKKLPLKPTGSLKTAADAMRVFEQRLEAALDEAAQQVRDINAGKGAKK